MQVASVPRRSLFEWRDLYESYRRQDAGLPTSTLTALTEFDRTPRLVRLGTTADGAPPQHCDADIHAPPPNFPNDDLGELPSSAALEEEVEDHLEKTKAVQAQVLQQYHPSFRALTRPAEEAREQEDFSKLYWDRPYGYEWFEIQLKTVNFKVGEFEPLYCTLALYWIDYKVEKNHQVTVNVNNSGRISESFAFEVSSVAIQDQFRDGSEEGGSGYLESKNAMFSILPDQRSVGLFLVLQVSKVLQGDPDKVLEPYARGKGSTAQLGSKALEAHQRLGSYKQPLAFGFCQIFTEKGGIADGFDSRKGLAAPLLPIYKQRTSWSDSQLISAIGEILQEPQAAKERAMEGHCIMLVQEVGTLPDVPKMTPRPMLVDSTLSCKLRLDDADPSRPESMSPSSSDAITHTVSSLNGPPSPTATQSHTSRIVREVRPLPMWNFNINAGPEQRGRAQVPINTSFSNVLYVYPLTLERSQYRNLAIKVELRALRDRPERASISSPEGCEGLINGAALPCIYNRQRGPIFTSYAYTQVSYHTKTPTMNDEIKIRLPDVLTPSHCLVFSVYHVHVKKQSDLSRRLTTTLKTAVGATTSGGPTAESKNSATLIGIGSLPLLAGEQGGPGCLLPDAVYALTLPPPSHMLFPVTADGIVMEEDGDDADAASQVATPTTGPGASPSTPGEMAPMTLRIGTIAQSSVHAQDEKLSQFFLAQPRPYASYHGASQEILSCVESGVDSSPLRASTRRLSQASQEAEVSRLCDAMRALMDSPDASVAAHFLPIMRQVFRALLGGTGIVGPQWADPIAIPTLRVWSFVTLLHVFTKASNGAQVVQTSEDRELNVLRAYAEMVFDEDHAGGAIKPRRRRSTEKASTLSGPLTPQEEAPKTPTGAGQPDGESSSEASGGSPSKHMAAKRRGMQSSGGSSTLSTTTQAELANINSGMVARARAKWENWNTPSDSSVRSSVEKRRGSGKSEAVVPLPPSTPTQSDVKAVQVVKLTGSRDRWEAAMAEGGPPQRWWPWAYEVLIAQWRALMRVYQEVDVELTRRSSGGDSAEYPLSKEELPAKTREGGQMHAAALFRIIKKSLALRLYHEGLEAPVLLDDDCMWAIEDLVCALAHEISERCMKGLWMAADLNRSLAGFLRDLFQLVHPAQTAILVKSYFKCLRNAVMTEHMDLKYEFLETLLQYDYVQINRPWLFNHPREEAVDETGAKVGNVEGPEAHWLARLTIDECIQSVNHQEGSVRVRGISLLRQVLVQHCFDAGYQDPALREGIAAMYLPLIGHLVQKADTLQKQAIGSSDRKELLACLLYVLQNSPQRLLRGLWRHIISAQETLPDETANRMVQQSAQAVCQNGSHGYEQLMRVLSLVELAIDTFEYPFGTPGARDDNSSPLHVLVPGIKTLGGASSPRGSTLPGGGAHHHSDTVGRGSTLGGTGPTGSDALHVLNSLLQDTKGRNTRGGGGDRRLNKGDNAGVRAWKHQYTKHGDSMIKTNTVSRIGEANQITLAKACKWVCHQAAQVILGTLSSVAREVVAMERAKITAAQSVRKYGKPSYGASKGLPPTPHQQQQPHPPPHTHHRSLSSLPPSPAIKLLTPAVYKTLLHILTTGQSDLTLIRCLEDTTAFIKDVGIETFLDPRSNAPRDWLKQVVIYCNHTRPALRTAARDFLVSLLHFTFVKTGSVMRIRVPLQHVFCDALSWVWATLDKTRSSINPESAEVIRVKALALTAPLRKCLSDALLLPAAVNGVGVCVSPYIHTPASHTSTTRTVTFGPTVDAASATTITTSTTAARRRSSSSSSSTASSSASAGAAGSNNSSGGDGGVGGGSGGGQREKRAGSGGIVGGGSGGGNGSAGKATETNDAIALLAPSVVPQDAGMAFQQRTHTVLSGLLLLVEAFITNLQLDNLCARMNVYSQRMKTRDFSSQQQQELAGLTDEPVIQELLLRTSELFDAHTSPEDRIHWLQRLSAFHQLRGNAAEVACTQVKIFDALSAVLSQYDELGATTATTPTPTLQPQSSRASVSAFGTSPLVLSADQPPSAPSTSPPKRRYSLRADSKGGVTSMSAVDPEALTVGYSAWRSRDEIKRQLLESADLAASHFAAGGFPLLAVGCSNVILDLHRKELDLAGMAQVYQQLQERLDDASRQRLSVEYLGREFTLGGYYRVNIFGPGFPDGKEYVYRLKSRKHITEFQDRLVNTLQKPNGSRIRKECIKVVPDSADEKTLMETETDKEVVYLKITSIKPVMGDDWPAADHEYNKGRVAENVEMGVSRFYYSVPFTKKGSSHGGTAEQWKRTTELMVEHPFPFCSTRQVVKRRIVTQQSPIECAIDDVKQRCKVIREMLARPSPQTNKNAMMQLLQGSVVPQVHGGASEVATVFLSPGSLASFTVANQDEPESSRLTPEKFMALQSLLRVQLVEFLHLCFSLILKSREILGITRRRASPVEASPGGGLATGLTAVDPNKPVDNQTILWQKEVESGFNSMVVKLYPMINQVEAAVELFRKASELEAPKFATVA